MLCGRYTINVAYDCGCVCVTSRGSSTCAGLSFFFFSPLRDDAFSKPPMDLADPRISFALCSMPVGLLGFSFSFATINNDIWRCIGQTVIGVDE